ncbi:glycoside hydrolase family 2 protein [Paenibacillus sp.]|uniref:glycoside hydrolase family 2 protein n=1 Tax=Paenibacillus sp. TaxID=58172 RepID=UPI002D2E7DF6|nr:sugar-binding domain-containing protein [Paenibacillus sp.]HZG55753.1 glycoside hydrolase family 2 TIM barrel-domain containing protein [Paenibacillus sp.]
MRRQWKLSGSWSFEIDPKDLGEANGWYEPGRTGGMEVQVPHIWQREPAFLNYYGAAWYTRSFRLESREPGRRVYVRFEAVDYAARVWVNGRYAGEHEGGFTPFEFDITDCLTEHGDQSISVRVYDPQDNADIPIGKQGSWYTRVSGIWQDVYLEERSPVYIDKAWITPDIERGAITVKYRLGGFVPANGGISLSYTVAHHLSGDVVTPGRMYAVDSPEGVFVVEIPNATLWSPENPHLYDLHLELVSQGAIDRKTDRFGMRKVEHADGMVQLNGKPLYIRGALDQAFYPDTIYTAPSDEYIQREIQLAKEMGFNLLRKHIKVELPRYLYWADRMGMLIWAETPNYVKWTPTGTQRFRNDLFAMVDRDYNCPSIVIWSLYNEEWGLEWDMAADPEKQRHVAELYDDLKAYDPTRLLCDNSGWTHVKTDINDHHRYFVCPDQLDAWKRDLDEFVVGDPDRNFVEGYRSNGEPIIVSEFGVWGLPSMEKLKAHYGDQEPWWFINQGEESHQEDYKKPITAEAHFSKFGLDRAFESFEQLAVASQRRMFRAVKSVIEEMRKRPAVAGYVVTEFTDIEWETNGWLDYLRNPKEGFERLKDFNGALAVMADGVKHNLWAGERQAWDVVISNHDLRFFRGVVRWSIEGTEASGEIPLHVDGELHVRLEKSIVFVVPEVTKAGTYSLRLELRNGEEIVASNEEELTFSPRELRLPGTPVTPYRLPADFAERLQAHGADVQEELRQDAVILTDCLDQAVLNVVREGGHAVFLAERGEQLLHRAQFTFRHLPEGESWPRASSFNFVDTSRFDGVPLLPEMGWEVDELIPNYVLPFTDYKIGGGRRSIPLFGNPGLAESSEIISGYFQGWIGQVGGSIVRKPYGKGSILVVTWRLLDHYGKHPTATQVLHKLLEMK